jgi:hypothetical protein
MANINASEYENKLSCMIVNQTKENICSYLLIFAVIFYAEIQYNIKEVLIKGTANISD